MSHPSSLWRDSHARCYMQDNSRTWRLSQRLPVPPRARWYTYLQHPGKVSGHHGDPTFGKEEPNQTALRTEPSLRLTGSAWNIESFRWETFCLFLCSSSSQKGNCAKDDDSDASALALRLHVSFGHRILQDVMPGKKREVGGWAGGETEWKLEPMS